MGENIGILLLQGELVYMPVKQTSVDCHGLSFNFQLERRQVEEKWSSVLLFILLLHTHHTFFVFFFPFHLLLHYLA